MVSRAVIRGWEVVPSPPRSGARPFTILKHEIKTEKLSKKIPISTRVEIFTLALKSFLSLRLEKIRASPSLDANFNDFNA